MEAAQLSGAPPPPEGWKSRTCSSHSNPLDSERGGKKKIAEKATCVNPCRNIERLYRRQKYTICFIPSLLYLQRTRVSSLYGPGKHEGHTLATLPVR